MKQLLIGCGSNHERRLFGPDGQGFTDLTTLDYNADHKPDIVWDLMQMPYPFEDDAFDEIHAYEVLEHTGAQGDYKFFFAQFSELWRILKPGGQLFVTCPSRFSVWALGDPSHTRVLQRENLSFLSQDIYRKGVGNTSMSDFRSIYKADFNALFIDENENSFAFVIEAVKPARLEGR